ncbi:MAG: ABC transporter permease, partial [Actinomycetota bacterium]
GTTALLIPERRTFDILSSLVLQSEERALPSPLSLDQSLLVVWPQVTGLLAATVICFAAAYILFMRQEVRA